MKDSLTLTLTRDNVLNAMKVLGLEVSDYNIDEVMNTVIKLTDQDMFNNLRWVLEHEHVHPLEATMREVA